MEYRPLGSSGFVVSVLGLGTNAFGRRADRATAHRILDRAVDAGITLIDTANTYSQGESETIIGEWLARRRQDAVVATKAGLPMGHGPNDRGTTRYHLRRELEKSLRRLQTDYVDLYQVHTFDPRTPLEETIETLDTFVRQGMVRYVGASNYRAWELMKALGVADRLHAVRFVTNQISYSLADRTPEREMMALAGAERVGIIAYFPLASGILTGKYRPGEPPPEGSRGAAGGARYQDRALLELGMAVREVAESLGATASQVALAWLYTRPEVTSAIAGARTVDQLEENLGSVEVTLPPEALERLDAVSRPFAAREPFSEARID